MRRLCALSFVLSLLMPTAVFADSLSISAWSTGDALNATNLNSRHTTIQNWANGNITDTNIGSSAAIAGSKLDLTSGTGRISHSTSVTSDAPVLTSAQTWNSAGTVFSGWRLNVTNTNSASASRLLDLQVGGTVIASISRVGQFDLYPQAVSSGSRGTDGALFNIGAATYTENQAAASGTVSNWVAYAFQRPTLAAANTSVTTTSAATVYIANAPAAGTNQTISNPYALWVAAGNIRFGGIIGATAALGTGPIINFNAAFFDFYGGTTSTRWFNQAGTVANMTLTDAGILAVGTTVTSGSSAGSIVLPNAIPLRGVNLAGNGTFALISLSSGNLIAFGTPRIAAAVPGNFAADFYINFVDSNGAQFIVPAMNATW